MLHNNKMAMDLLYLLYLYFCLIHYSSGFKIYTLNQNTIALSKLSHKQSQIHLSELSFNITKSEFMMDRSYKCHLLVFVCNLAFLSGNRIFIQEPTNVTVMEYGNATFCCTYNVTNVLPVWRINSILYHIFSLPSELRLFRIQDGFCLFIRNVTLNFNSTIYQCSVSGIRSQIGVLLVQDPVVTVMPTTSTMSTSVMTFLNNATLSTIECLCKDHMMTSNLPTITLNTVSLFPTTVGTIYTRKYELSVLVSSSIVSGLVMSVLTGIPVLLVGLLIGMQYQKHRAKASASILSVTLQHMPKENTDLVDSANVPVYEEIKEKTKDIQLKHNVAYETVQV